MGKDFLHCLRVQFAPGNYEDERIAEVADYCEKFGFGNVMLFINAEEYNVGHMTIEEAKPWIKTLKKAKAVLEQRGITVSLNPWMELGHLDRCRTLKVGQNFTTMVDFDGHTATMVACPLCGNWKKYFLEFYEYMLREICPDTVWIEDDFRLHNHANLVYGGCFCDLHMKKYNERLNANYTRQEFTDRLFRKNPEKRVKKAWLDVSRECIRSLAEEIGEAIKNIGLGTKVGLMSSMHQMHALEGRDWHGVHKGLSAGGPMINRLHLPCYSEISGKQYYYEFNKAPFLCRALLPKETIIYPELENGSFSTFSKEARFLQFQLESAIPLCISGMTYDIYDFVGNGIVHEFGYGEVVKGITPYLNGVLSLNLKFDSLEGVILPIDEKTVYKRDNKINSFYDLLPDESAFNAHVTSLGISSKPSTQKTFKNKVVALGLGNVYNFTTKQLINLFKDNFVIVEGGAVRILIERGLGDLIGATSCETYYAENNVHSYEEAKDGVLINGKKGYRATTHAKAGNYVKIDYKDESGAKSYVYDYLGNKVGVGAMDGGNYFVIPFVISEILHDQHHDLRTTLLKRFLLKTGTEFVLTNHSGVYAYLYKQKHKTIVIVVNSTEQDFEKTSLQFSGVEFSKIVTVGRKSGKKRSVNFETKDGVTVIDCKNERLTTQTFILTK